MKTTEDLRNDVIKIRDQLEAGTISNAIARTLIFGSKIVLDTLKVEMEAARLGTSFSAVHFDEEDRPKPGKSKH
jgi:hypothetical protein